MTSNRESSVFLADLNNEEYARFVAQAGPKVILLPLGSIEPHGPHLPLLTDTLISEAIAKQAQVLLDQKGVNTLIAPSVSYAVTNCAASFKGAISISAKNLTNLLVDIVNSFIKNDIQHVCLINNHLEPEHETAVRAVAENFDSKQLSIASPLNKSWGRKLTDEFKSGACHAGCYETSILLADCPDKLDMEVAKSMPEVPISLSEKLKVGVTDFKEMGLERAYSGSPGQATEKEGVTSINSLAKLLVAMVLGFVEY